MPRRGNSAWLDDKKEMDQTILYRMAQKHYRRELRDIRRSPEYHSGVRNNQVSMEQGLIDRLAALYRVPKHIFEDMR